MTTTVYWTNGGGGGQVVKCATGGCGGDAGILASGQSSPHGIAVDANAVYFFSGSQVMKLAK